MDETTPQLLTITRRFPALALSRLATRSEGLQNFVVGASQVGKQAQAHSPHDNESRADGVMQVALTCRLEWCWLSFSLLY